MILTIIFLVVLWIMSMTLAFIGGRFSVREEIKEAEQKRSLMVNVDGPEYLQGPPGPVGAMGNPGPPGMDGKTPDASDLIVDKDLGLTLLEWKDAVESRLKRAEKKAGMSV